MESLVFILFWITNQFHYTRTFCHVQSSYYSYNAFIPFITNNDMVTRLYLVIKNTWCYKHLIGKILALARNNSGQHRIIFTPVCILINQLLIIITWIYAIIGVYVIIFMYISDYNKSIKLKLFDAFMLPWHTRNFVQSATFVMKIETGWHLF